VPVSASDEAECLGELLGERRKLGGALGEVVDGPQLFGRRGRNRLSLLTRRLRPGAGLTE
jgi:hypothetical protein